MKNNTVILAAIALLTFSATAQKTKTVKIKPVSKFVLDIPEPSDICTKPGTDSFYIVSDNGLLFETDAQGNITQKADYKGLDSEGVWADDTHVYVIEEFSRKIRIFDRNTLKITQTLTVPYGGGRNKGYESFTYNKTKEKFILITEKSPIYIFELDKDLKLVNEIDISGIANDISAATYYNGFIWLLSDEDSTVFKVNPDDYSVITSWKIPILNPEGITFNNNGDLIITSDDMHTMYIFNNPESN